MKYIFLIAGILFLSWCVWVIYSFYQMAEFRKDTRKEIEYIERQIDLTNELHEEQEKKIEEIFRDMPIERNKG